MNIKKVDIAGAFAMFAETFSPKIVAHRVVPDGHVKLLLFEPAATTTALAGAEKEIEVRGARAL